MSKNNLLKRGYTVLAQDDARVINVNELMAKRMEEWAAKVQQTENDGFVSGIVTDVIEPIEGYEGEEGSNVIKAGAGPEDILEEARREAEEILENARVKAAEIEQLAATQTQHEKDKVLAQAKQQGYIDGMEKLRAETERLENEYREKEKKLEAEYQALLDELEPQFVDTITGIYEHIFHVELGAYREILSHLIATTMRKAESNKVFLVHVSKEDYPYVSMQKKQIAAGATAPNSTVEIVEDITISQNECLIETEGGIFDCGLGTQLSELRQKLKLLSYEK